MIHQVCPKASWDLVRRYSVLRRMQQKVRIHGRTFRRCQLPSSRQVLKRRRACIRHFHENLHNWISNPGPQILHLVSSNKVTLTAPNKIDKFFFLLKTIHMSLQTTPVTLGNKLLNFSAADVKVKEGKASNPHFAQVLEIYACYARILFRCDFISSISQRLFCTS